MREPWYRRMFVRNAKPDGAVGDRRSRACGLVEQGLIAEREGDLAQAVRLYRDAIVAEPGFAPAQMNLGIALQGVGALDEAIAALSLSATLDAGSAAAHFNLAMALVAGHHVTKAESEFRLALELQPNFPEARVGLAEVLETSGNLQEALGELQAALRLRPGYAGARFNAILLLHRLGEAAAAKEMLAALDLGALLSPTTGAPGLEGMARSLLDIWPEYAAGWRALGTALALQGRLAEAAPALKRAASAYPDDAEFQNTLGAALQAVGAISDAEAAYARALALQPDYHEARGNLATLLVAQDRGAEAEDHYRRIAEFRPDFAQAHRNLGNLLRAFGRVEEAERCLRRALALDPAVREAHNDLGVTLLGVGRQAEAAECFRSALSLAPDFQEAHNNLALALQEMRRPGEAEASYRRALELAPDNPATCSNLGSALRDLGRAGEAVACFRRAIALDPGYSEAHSNLLFTLLNMSGVSSSQLFAEHLAWAQRHAAPLATQHREHANNRDTVRRLRIGYVSPDFRRHSVACFIEPLLERHARDAFAVYCYSNVARPDETTRRLLGLADESRDITAISDARAAALVRDDGIDILVDLAGHTARGRLGLFALKPAPVQATCIGYPNTTGLAAIDWRLTNAIADPPGVSDTHYTEALARYPRSFLCFRPPAQASKVQPAPCMRNGYITFGSFNALAKLGPAVILAWSQILTSVPDSRLMLKAPGLADDSGRARIAYLFARQGIAERRLTLLPPENEMGAHLARYHEIDVGLDPFPYNGTTTTLEALWMGVPVVSVAGDRHAARTGASILDCLNLNELLATDTKDYVSRASKLAGEPRYLSELRATMRERFDASPLRDEAAYVRATEDIYRDMWRAWCAR